MHRHTSVTLEAVVPTCTEEGLTAGEKCSGCGKILVEQTPVEAKGHTEEALPAVPATCTEDGLSEGKKCTVCQSELKEEHKLENNKCDCGFSNATEKTVTLSFANTSKRESQTTLQQVWKCDGVTFTNNKASSTNDVIDSSNPVRLYANSQVIIEATGGITKIVFK